MRTADSFSNKFISISFGLGMIFSPDNLGLFGNIMGQTGWIGLGILALATAVYIIHARNYHFLLTQFPHASGELRVLQKHLGSGIGYLPFIVKIYTAMVLSTGILVSAGFVFNEVFAYWFPNFAFAFILLGFVFGMSLFNEKISCHAQLIFIGTSITGLVLLIIIGLGQSIEPPTLNLKMPLITANSIFLPILLWVGFDLGFFSAGEHVSKKNSHDLVWVIILAGGVFALWGVTTIFYVPLEKLTATSISHIITARSISPEYGRHIMGTIIIAGTLATVNALFAGSVKHAQMLVKNKIFPVWFNRSYIMTGFLSGSVAIMLATGLAGETILESLIRSALISWLLLYSLIDICTHLEKKQTIKSNALTSLGASLTTITACIILIEGNFTIFILLCLMGGVSLVAGIFIPVK